MPINVKDLTDIVKSSEAIYSKEVILNRAIPDLRDGMKPVHRRILYMAYKQGLLHNHRYMKVAKLSGLVLGLHPHGDSSVNGATVTLSQEWNLKEPLIDIHGSNGGIDGSGAAAARYIEARLTYPAELLLKDINKDCIEMVENFDSTMKEPTVLPASWPVALTNGTSGIAVGMATNILPHNPKELLDGAIYLAQHPHGTDKHLKKLIPGPDFPTGGTIIGYNGINDEFEKGKASIKVRGTAKIDSKNKQIVITEVPFTVTTTDLKESIEKVLDDQATALGITGLDDESSNKVRIVIHFKKRAKATQMQTALNLLYQKSDLEITLHPNNNLIWEHHPVRVGIKEYLKDFLKFRAQTLVKILKFDYQQAQKRLNIVNGFLKLIDMADQVTKAAKTSNGRQDFEKVLQNKFKFNAAQAHAIAGLPLYRLGRQDQTKLTNEKTGLTKRIKTIRAVLSDKKLFLKFLITDLRRTRKVFRNNKRQTNIIPEEKIAPVHINHQILIKLKPVIVTAKASGVIQRMSHQVYNNNINDYDNKDELVATLQANTRQGALFFTRNGISYYRNVNELENMNVKSDPESVQLSIPTYKANDQTINADNFDLPLKAHQRYLISLSAQGTFKIIDESQLIPNTNNKGYLTRTITYNGLRRKDDYVVFSQVITEQQRQTGILHLNSTKKRTQARNLILKNENIQGRTGSGRRIYKLDPDKDEKFTNIKINYPEDDKQNKDQKPEDKKTVSKPTTKKDETKKSATKTTDKKSTSKSTTKKTTKTNKRTHKKQTSKSKK